MDRGPQPTLTGTSVDLRPWQPSDAAVVLDACQDDDIQRWTPLPFPYTAAHANEFVGPTTAKTWENGGGLFAVVDRADKDVVGSMGAHEVRDGVAYAGYWTRPESRGRGYTSDALRTLTRWLVDDVGVARVEMVIEPGNVASVRVAESAGFVNEGTLRQRFLLKGRRVDGCIFGLLPSDLA